MEPRLRMDTVTSLHEIVSGMNLDNFVVRPHRRLVERYSHQISWQEISATEAGDIAENLAGLPSSVRDDGEDAKRFDLLLLRLQLAQLDGDAVTMERLRGQVQAIAEALLEQTSIPSVAAQQQLLDQVAGDDWWVDVTLPMLELARRRIRGLVGFIEKLRKGAVYTDFADELGTETTIDLPGISVGTNWERFLAKARAYLLAHADHLSLQRLRRNLPLTRDDLVALELMLVESGAGSAADIARAAEESQGLGLFVRSLVGLDRAAATQAMSRFLSDSSYSAAQLRFVTMIVEHLTENGMMEAKRLYEPPFTDDAPGGPELLFAEGQVDDIIATLNDVRAQASPDVTVA